MLGRGQVRWESQIFPTSRGDKSKPASAFEAGEMELLVDGKKKFRKERLLKKGVFHELLLKRTKGVSKKIATSASKLPSSRRAAVLGKVAKVYKLKGR